MRLFMAAILISAAAVLGSAATAGAAPANDGFAAATPIADAQGAHAGTTLGATKEAGEPNHAGNPGGHSIWYRWTAPETGTFVFHTLASSFDTLLAVYTGTDVGTLTEVVSNDDIVGWSTSRSRVAFHATAGMEYAIAVDGFGGKSGRSGLDWYRGRANDLFARPEAVSGSVGSLAGTNAGATSEGFEPTPWGSTTSVWYEWIAPATGAVKFSTTNRFRFDLDSVLAVYTGASLEALTLVAENDDDPDLGCCSSFVGFEAVAGTGYRIAVGGLGGGSGPFTLSWSPLILGTGAADTLVGTAGVEEIRGLGGNDLIRGLGGADVLVGGSGNDRTFGGPGSDLIGDVRGLDLLDGGSGADVLHAQDFTGRDVLRGGLGSDTCRADPRDVRRSC